MRHRYFFTLSGRTSLLSVSYWVLQLAIKLFELARKFGETRLFGFHLSGEVNFLELICSFEDDSVRN